MTLQHGTDSTAKSYGWSFMGIHFPSRIFPLHLSPIERFLLDDDRDSHPMAFVIEMDFEGVVETEVFQRAMVAALHRHPLLISRIGPAKNQAECWLKPDGMLPKVNIGALGEAIELPDGERIDLKNEVGLRIWIRLGADRSRVTFQFHHVCCDGIGAYRFIGDLLAYYSAGIAGDLAPEIPNIDLKRLRGRADRCRFLSRDAKASDLIKGSLRDCYRIVGRGCDGLTVNRANKGSAAKGVALNPFPGLSSFTFSAAEFSRLRDVSKEMGLMLNDLLILELFQAMHFWNAEMRGRESDGNYRIMMPVDLRSTDDFETPAANVIGYTFLSRRGRELKDRQQLAAGIREETAGIKHNRLGERFNDMVAMGDHVRPLKKLAMRMPRALCTAVLSNIGDPSRRFLAKFQRRGGCIVAGNLVLQHISGFPPVRKRSRASFSIVTYRRELTIGVRCDPYEFSKSDTDRLLMLYVAAISKHLPQSEQASAETLDSAVVAPQLAVVG